MLCSSSSLLISYLCFCFPFLLLMRAVAPCDDISADVTSAVSGFSFLGSSLPRPFCKVTCFLAHMSLHPFTHPPGLSSGPQQPCSDGGDHPLLWVPPAYFAYFSYTHVSPEHPLFYSYVTSHPTHLFKYACVLSMCQNMILCPPQLAVLHF